MSIEAVLFDLDGTLLPMEAERFSKAYFTGIAKKLAPIGYEPEELIKSIWQGIKAMVMNDGKLVNEQVFWNVFSKIYGEKCFADKAYFDEFYKIDFDEIKSCCGYTEKAAQIVRGLTKKGIRVVLATNPVFPSIATEKRMGWAGLKPEDFEFFTTYENSCYCKPNLQYYESILQKLALPAEKCVMVGNDVTEDMVAQRLGMKVFLLNDCIINKDGKDISAYPNGGFDDLSEFLNDII